VETPDLLVGVMLGRVDPLSGRWSNRNAYRSPCRREGVHVRYCTFVLARMTKGGREAMRKGMKLREVEMSPIHHVIR
jgi:hypothetical protein